ncbi:MAG TPA: type IV pilus modification protein PilV [Steroidobacteraceae bacterium]|nr:type IV pilus modification protein PilV [Steroidobacteraceae bacterium]
MRTEKPFLRMKKVRGTTLVETLVALLVLSIGLLGVAGMQMTSLQNNRGAHLRSQAQVLAYDIADRMRANRTVALAGGYIIALGATVANDGTIQAIDLESWKGALAVTLPGGDGQVDQIGLNLVRITVRWTDSLGTQQFTTQTRI